MVASQGLDGSLPSGEHILSVCVQEHATHLLVWNASLSQIHWGLHSFIRQLVNPEISFGGADTDTNNQQFCQRIWKDRFPQVGSSWRFGFRTYVEQDSSTDSFQRFSSFLGLAKAVSFPFWALLVSASPHHQTDLLTPCSLLLPWQWVRLPLRHGMPCSEAHERYHEDQCRQQTLGLCCLWWTWRLCRSFFSDFQDLEDGVCQSDLSRQFQRICIGYCTKNYKMIHYGKWADR